MNVRWPVIVCAACSNGEHAPDASDEPCLATATAVYAEDGVGQWTDLLTYDGRGNELSLERDIGLDGVIDTRYVRTYDAADHMLTSRADLDVDEDGVLETCSLTSWGYDKAVS